MKRLAILCLVAVVGFTSCSKDDDGPASNVISKTKTISVAFSSTGSFTFFRFSDSAIVANSDSATTKWDFGVRFTKFIVNSHASGPGSAGAIVKSSTTFDAEKSAPSTGYGYDTTSTQTAINANTWYNYNSTTHTFSPKAGQVIFFKTADGAHYAKAELLSVDYAPFTGPVPTTLLYTFRYSYQANGSTSFE